MKNLLLLLFLLATAGDLLAVSVPAWAGLAYACKPLLLLSLGLYYYRASPNPSRLVLAALALSWLGDGLLLFQERQELFFIGGLLAFLAAHACYIGAYQQHQWAGPGRPLGWRLGVGLPVVVAGVALLAALSPGLGPLRLPVMLYAAVLVLMVLAGVYRAGRTTAGSFAAVAVGAGLFMASDSVLAINKFLEPLPNADFWIMLTYCAAQGCIVAGLLAHERAAVPTASRPA
ncbi:lysoplasmalogenase [Hymenobacter sp. DH14]|uniref:Lysoplasmalogenase n=1 Tax=Hymenobacter cyanobacteriorum TaxID=2926463 RepID=A0A9X1VCQ8_9BACT|nr:lysoplasmalogenase [Hymenobacter cyanobacteriorum]MCI1186754.1 lysoplasmalogenase [Hymenobacter cyanobacteriorum]